MSTKYEITVLYARAYAKASKSDKSRLLNEVIAVTGWNRDNARRRLVAAAKPKLVRDRTRKPRTPIYGYDTVKVLQQVWATSGGQCGKYLAQSMELVIRDLERHEHSVPGVARYSLENRAQLLAIEESHEIVPVSWGRFL